MPRLESCSTLAPSCADFPLASPCMLRTLALAPMRLVECASSTAQPRPSISTGGPPHLDGVSDVGHHLHGLAQVVTAALALNHILQHMMWW